MIYLDSNRFEWIRKDSNERKQWDRLNLDLGDIKNYFPSKELKHLPLHPSKHRMFSVFLSLSLCTFCQDMMGCCTEIIGQILLQYPWLHHTICIHSSAHWKTLGAQMEINFFITEPFPQSPASILSSQLMSSWFLTVQCADRCECSTFVLQVTS